MKKKIRILYSNNSYFHGETDVAIDTWKKILDTHKRRFFTLGENHIINLDHVVSIEVIPNESKPQQ